MRRERKSHYRWKNFFSHITDFLKDTLQPGKPIEHLETWYEKLSDSVPLSLVHAQRRPYVIKGRDLEKAETQKGFGDQKDQVETTCNLKDHPSQESVQESVPVPESLEESVQEPVQEPVQKSSQENPSQKALQKSRQKSTLIQDIVIPPGIPILL